MPEGSRLTLPGKLVVGLFLVGCAWATYYFLFHKSGAPIPSQSQGQSSASSTPGTTAEIGIAYGTEKQTWLEWAVQELVKPHIGQTIDSAVDAINAGLQALKSGGGTLGKVAVIVDPDLAEGC